MGVRSSCALAMLLGCAAPPSSDPPAAGPPVALEPTAEAPSHPGPPGLDPPPTVPPEPPKLGRDHRSAVPCTDDAACGWDSDCMPTRCVEARGEPESCEESAPAPGTCRCVAGLCTLEPKVAPEPTGTCELGACAVDRAAGRCVVDDGGNPPNLRPTPGVDVGPSCDCIFVQRGCTFSWFAPVPCTSVRDCWISPSPRRHPVARPKALRKRDFVPCDDGEVAPRCADGWCKLGPAYSC